MLQFMHNIIDGSAPTYFQDQINLVQHEHYTRGRKCDLLRNKKPEHEYLKKTIIYQGIDAWNKVSYNSRILKPQLLWMQIDYDYVLKLKKIKKRAISIKCLR